MKKAHRPRHRASLCRSGSIAGLVIYALVGAPAALAKDVSELSMLDRWRYHRCMDDATSKPTPRGVSQASSLCFQRFLADGLQGSSVLRKAEDAAAAFNRSAIKDDLISFARAEAAGSDVTVVVRMKAETINTDEAASFNEAALRVSCTHAMSREPLRQGVTYTYDLESASGARISRLHIKNADC